MRLAAAAALVVVTGAAAGAQSPREQLARGHELWRQRLSASAVAAFEAATRDPAAAAEAWEALGRIYTFKGWRQEGVFPGWHDETEYRDRTIAAFRSALAADRGRDSAAEGLKEAEAYAAAPGVVPPAPPEPDVAALDARIKALGASGSIEELDAAIAARTSRQADPAPYFMAAQLMLERRELARATEMANRGLAAAERFIAENEGAYRMAGKSRGARNRARAAALDILGTVALRRLDFDAAAAQLEEAERLSRGQDFLVQFHLGELAAARRDVERAETHFLAALALTGGPPALRERATEALAGVHAALERPEGFEAWLAEAIDRRRAERRGAALRSALDKPLAALPLRGAEDGRRVDLADYRGKVLLLNFFSSW